MSVREGHAKIEPRIVFHVKYGRHGLDGSTVMDFKGCRADDQIACLPKTIGTQRSTCSFHPGEGGIPVTLHGKRNFANKWLNHGVNRRGMNLKRATKLPAGTQTDPFPPFLRWNSVLDAMKWSLRLESIGGNKSCRNKNIEICVFLCYGLFWRFAVKVKGGLTIVENLLWTSSI